MDSDAVTRPFRFFDNREKYLLLVTPSVLILYRADQKFVLRPIMPQQGQPDHAYDLVIASQPFRARLPAEIQVHNVLAPLASSLAPGERMITVQSTGKDPGLEIIRAIWPGEDPCQPPRQVLLKDLRAQLRYSRPDLRYHHSADQRAEFSYVMHMHPTEISRSIGTSTLHAAWNAAIYMAQIKEDRSMATNTQVEVARAEVVGSLLRPVYLREARQGIRAGRGSDAELHAAEDRAVLEGIALQEALGLDVITDGEMRRAGWSVPLRAALSGFTAFPGGSGYRWRTGDPAQGLVRDDRDRAWPFVTALVQVRYNVAQAEYPFLHAHAHRRTKYCLPAPSYYRTNWHEARSRAVYPTVEEFLTTIRDYTHQVVRDVVAMGCDYVQLDAPNYGRACDPEFQMLMQTQHRSGAIADLRFDAALDSSVFDGITGITRAIHICRGNSAGAWNAQGGYGAIAADLFPRLNMDVLLLEYDTPRAGDFGPLRHVLPQHTVVLGLLTTKAGRLEDLATVEARIREAATCVPLERLALSPQCGFASVEAGNPLTSEEQEAKLRLVAQVARRVWGVGGGLSAVARGQSAAG